MPSSHSLVVRAVPRIAAILSTITLFALAGCGSESDDIQEDPVQVTDSPSTPSISGSPQGAVVIGQAYTFTPQATDPNGDTLTFEIQNRPAWATFEAATGRLSGTPTAAQVGTYSNVTISVSDGRTRASLPAFTISVNAVADGQATLSWTAPTLRSDATPLSDLAGYRIYYGTTPDSFTQMITVNTAGVTTYVLENLGQGTWYFAIAAFDSTGMESALSNPASKTIS
jgi:hypothetical protein